MKNEKNKSKLKIKIILNVLIYYNFFYWCIGGKSEEYILLVVCWLIVNCFLFNRLVDRLLIVKIRVIVYYY